MTLTDINCMLKRARMALEVKEKYSTSPEAQKAFHLAVLSISDAMQQLSETESVVDRDLRARRQLGI